MTKTNNLKEIKELFFLLSRSYRLWRLFTLLQKKALFENLEIFFIRLEKLGVEKSFSILLVLYGKEFLDFEWPEKQNLKFKMTNREIERIFRVGMVTQSLKNARLHVEARSKGYLIYKVTGTSIEPVLTLKQANEHVREHKAEVKLNNLKNREQKKMF